METFWNRRRKRRKKGIREKEKKKKQNENWLIKHKIIRDIRSLFELEEDYYKPKRVSGFWNNNCIKYESNRDKNSNLSLDEYLNKTKPYLPNIIIDLQNSDTWKIQLTIAINFISSKHVEEELVGTQLVKHKICNL